MTGPRVSAAPLGVLALLVALLVAWWAFRPLTRGEVPGPGSGPGAAPIEPAAEPEPRAPGRAAAAQPPGLGPPAGFVDEGLCATCHAEQAEAWSTSHHALAMQPATEGSVLGDFDGTLFEGPGGTTRFFRDQADAAARTEAVAAGTDTDRAPWPDGGFRVETTGPEGRSRVFPVPYVFGVEPLQQLLLPLAGGRLQAFSVAWDNQAQRWYSLYPDERIEPRDPLHWSRGALNWNFSCAECHATDLKRGYDAEQSRYQTRWQRLDVGCQACHGPAAGHLAWITGGGEETPGHGFEAPIQASSRVEIEACARCHSRRAPLDDGFDHRHRLMDDYLPALLGEELYFADGQIQDEVYEYGSFLQSVMHARGVRCSDCHEPHSASLLRPGNLLCTACHSATPELPAHVDGKTLQRKAYDTPAHTLHAPGTPGSFCVDCHMPSRTYMGVDPRRDHGLRVPRPEVSARIGAPDACSSCHADRDAAWAAAEIARRLPKSPRPAPFGPQLHAGRRGLPGAAAGLLDLAGGEGPPIVRASALELLTRYPGRRALERFVQALEDPDPQVRHAALGGLELLSPPERAPLVTARLTDPVRAVRIEAARLLLELREGAEQEPRAAAEAEYEASQRKLLERPEGRLNLARLLGVRGDAAGAEAQLRAALTLDPSYVPAAVNLAEWQRARSEPEAESTLRAALDSNPDAAPLEHALGLALVRQGRRAEALQWLERAARHAPDEPRFGYVLAIAFRDAGREDEARAELERVRATSPWFRDAHIALAKTFQSAGDAEAMHQALDALRAINPDDPALPPR